MGLTVTGLVVACLLGMATANQGYSPHAQEPLARAKSLVKRMTLSEKIRMLQGANGVRNTSWTGLVPGVPRLGVPALRMNDGPQGFHSRSHPGSSTQWPSGLTMAHSWDVKLFKEWGRAMGAEFYAKGANVQFGPAVNVARIPNGGRSFEYLSGEDPYLGSQLVQPVLTGIQSQGVIANVKHYIANNQEGLEGQGDRHSTSENVDERTLMELYFPPFEAAVQAGVLSVMCGNNLLNGDYVCQSKSAEKTMLKQWAGFQGWVCSDYDGTRSTIQAAQNGLDIAMPGPPSRPDYFGSMLLDAVKKGEVDVQEINDKVVRVVYSMAMVGALDYQNNNTEANDVTSAAHSALARKLAGSCVVLLKNDGLLPLNKSVKKIAVLGIAGDGDTAVYGGGGSGAVVPKSPVSVFQGLSNHGGVVVEFNNATNIAEAKLAAQAADVAVFVLAATSSEGHDRPDLTLGSQSSLVSAIAVVQPNIVVVAVSPGPYLTPWSDDARAILDVGFPGEQEGNAVADVLFGHVNPSGRLPHTMPNRPHEMNFTARQYPGLPPSNKTGPPCTSKPQAVPSFEPCSPTMAYYDEKLHVGYRWYQANNVVPKFGFGHGLSYTTFNFSGLDISGRNVTIRVRNTGHVDGQEVIQLYIRYPQSSGESEFVQLRGFHKTRVLKPLDEEVALFTISDRWLSVWDSVTHSWELVKGEHTVDVGASSIDIRASGILRCE